MKSIKLLAATAALAVSGAAVAGPSYTYLDVGYVSGDSFGSGNDTEAFALRGSFGFAEMFHVGAGYIDGEALGGKDSGGADVSGYNIYVGINPAITENVDLVGRIGYLAGEGDVQFGPTGQTLDADAFYLEVGPRAMIGDQLELSAYVTWADGSVDNIGVNAGDSDVRDIGYFIGGAYYVTPAISIGVDAKVDGGNTLGNLYARYSFGNN